MRKRTTGTLPPHAETNDADWEQMEEELMGKSVGWLFGKLRDHGVDYKGLTEKWELVTLLQPLLYKSQKVDGQTTTSPATVKAGPSRKMTGEAAPSPATKPSTPNGAPKSGTGSGVYSAKAAAGSGADDGAGSENSEATSWSEAARERYGLDPRPLSQSRPAPPAQNVANSGAPRNSPLHRSDAADAAEDDSDHEYEGSRLSRRGWCQPFAHADPRKRMKGWKPHHFAENNPQYDGYILVHVNDRIAKRTSILCRPEITIGEFKVYMRMSGV